MLLPSNIYAFVTLLLSISYDMASWRSIANGKIEQFFSCFISSENVISPAMPFALFSCVIHERVAIGVLLVDVVVFSRWFFPVGIVREEGVCLSRGVVYLCETETIGEWKGLIIYRSSTYYIYILVWRAMTERILKGRIDVTAWQFTDGAWENHVATVWQCAFRQWVEGVASHYYCVARGKSFEAFEVVW